MRYFWFLVAVSVLPACAPMPKALFTPPGADRPWEISGQYKDHTNELTITINGAPVIKGILDHRRGQNTLTGSYGGRSISVTCVSEPNYLRDQERCTVLVDGAQAAVLTL